MKSIVSILLTAVMLMTVLTACGKTTSQNVATSPEPSPTTAVAATPEPENALDKAEDKIDQAADKVEDKVEGAVDDMEEDMTPEEYPTNDLVGQPSPLPETEQEQEDAASNQRAARSGQ
jgi:hypothetical protein